LHGAPADLQLQRGARDRSGALDRVEHMIKNHVAQRHNEHGDASPLWARHSNRSSCRESAGELAGELGASSSAAIVGGGGELLGRCSSNARRTDSPCSRRQRAQNRATDLRPHPSSQSRIRRIRPSRASSRHCRKPRPFADPWPFIFGRGQLERCADVHLDTSGQVIPTSRRPCYGTALMQSTKTLIALLDVRIAAGFVREAEKKIRRQPAIGRPYLTRALDNYRRSLARLDRVTSITAH
jgi:hypothetical protein